MAEFGVKATQMSAANTGAAKFVKQPVQDQSKNMMLGSALELAGEAYKGQQVASLEKAQESVIDEYLQPRQLEQDIGALEAATDNIWKRIDKDASYSPDVADLTGIEKTLTEKLDKLRLAKEQGLMSPQDFTNRILATTREAVNRNPGLYNELKQHSSRVLEMSGIMDVVKADAKAMESRQKQVDDLNDRILNLAGQNNVPIYMSPSGYPDMGRIKTAVDKIQTQKQIVATAENFGKLDTEEKKRVGRDFMSSGNGITLMNGKVDQLTSQFAGLLQQGGDVTGSLTQMRLMGEAAYQQYFQMLSPIVADSPAAKEALDYFRKQIDTTISFMEKATSKEDALKRSNSITTMMRNSNYQEASKMLNPDLLDMTTRILNTVGAPRILEKDPALMDNMIRTFGDLLGGVSGSPRVNYDATVQGKNVVSQGLVALAKEALTDTKALTYFEKAINTIATDVENPEKFTSTGQKFGFYEKLIRDLGDTTVKASISKLGTGTISQATGMIDDYMNLTIKDMWNQVLTWEKKGVTVEGDVLPDGRFIFKTSDRTATRDLNTRYSPRINDSLAAMTNLMGLDSKSVAVNQFYPNYLAQFADDSDLVPLEIKSKSDADAALKTGKITKQEYQGIINELK